MELENFSGRLADNVKQDFYAMMTAANMLAHFMRKANRKEKEREGSAAKYEYQVNVNHAVGVYKDWLIGAVAEKQNRVRFLRRCRLQQRSKNRARPATAAAPAA